MSSVRYGTRLGDLKNKQPTERETRTGEGCDPGNSGFWDGDYGWGVRVRRHFGARGMSSVRYATRLGDLKNKQSTESSK